MLLIPRIEKLLDKLFIKYDKNKLKIFSNYFYKKSKNSD
jgi:hypothetical protein